MQYFTVEGLRARVADDSQLYLCLIKELIDNGLDAGAKQVSVYLGQDKIRGRDVLTVSVVDDGQPFPRSDIEERFGSFDEYVGSKLFWRLPKRGAMGDALRLVLAAPYAISQAYSLNSPVFGMRIASGGIESTISAKIDLQRRSVKPVISAPRRVRSRGVEVTASWPIDREDRLMLGVGWKDVSRIADRLRDLVQRYLLFNPDVKFTVRVKQSRITLSLHSTTCRRHSGRTAISWYDFDSFQELLSDSARSNVRLEEFVQQFHGIESEDARRIAGEIGISKLSEIANQKRSARALYEILRRHTTPPNPQLLGAIGKDDLEKAVRRSYGNIIYGEISYGIQRAVTRSAASEVPYVVEVAVAKLAENHHRIIFGLNNSPFIKEPFSEYDSLSEHENIRAVLHKHRVDDQPLMIVIHLTSPLVEYTHPAKGEMNPRLFGKTLLSSLDSALSVYSQPKGLKITSTAMNWLRNWLTARKHRLETGEDLSKHMVTRNTIWYLMRKEIQFVTTKRRNFLRAINKICKKLGNGDEKYREMLGIYAAERGKLHFRGRETYIGYSSYKFLAEKGSDILVIEKEGMADILAPYASDYGVAIVNSRGFAANYVKLLAQQAAEKKSSRGQANIFALTDLDDSGILMAKKIEGIIRLGLDREMLDALGIDREKVEEPYDKPPEKRTHYQAEELTEAERAEVKDKRIELDSLLAYTTPEAIWDYLRKRMSELKNIRDLRRSMDLDSAPIPRKVKAEIEIIEDSIANLGKPILENAKHRFSTREQPIQNIRKIEDMISEKVELNLLKKRVVKEAIGQLTALASRLSQERPSEPMNPKP